MTYDLYFLSTKSTAVANIDDVVFDVCSMFVWRRFHRIALRSCVDCLTRIFNMTLYFGWFCLCAWESFFHFHSLYRHLQFSRAHLFVWAIKCNISDRISITFFPVRVIRQNSQRRLKSCIVCTCTMCWEMMCLIFHRTQLRLIYTWIR